MRDIDILSSTYLAESKKSHHSWCYELLHATMFVFIQTKEPCFRARQMLVHVSPEVKNHDVSQL